MPYAAHIHTYTHTCYISNTDVSLYKAIKTKGMLMPSHAQLRIKDSTLTVFVRDSYPLL